MSKVGSNNETDSFEEFFSSRLKNESMQPSEQVWERIEGSLRQDKKRKRRFIWLFFCGLIFIGAGISTYIFINVKNNLTNLSSKDLKNKLTSAVTDKKVVTETVKKEATLIRNETNVNTETAIASIEKVTAINENAKEKNINKENATNKSTAKEEKANVVRIQLGAFKKQIDKSIFDKTGLVVKGETSENGVTRYYAEVSENEKQEALQKVQQAGFTDAFVKHNILLGIKNDEVKGVENIYKPVQHNSNLLVVRNNEVKRVNKNTEPAPTKLNEIATTKPIVNQITKNINAARTKNTNADLPLANSGISIKNESSKNENVRAAIDETKQETTNEVETTNTNIVSADDKQVEEAKIEPVDVKQNVVAVKTDTEIKKDTAIVAVVNKEDSAKTDDKKKDEPLIAKTKTDSLPSTEKMSRWALLLTGGPNLFLKNTSNSLFNTTGEKQPPTYNASVKMEYKLFKKVAVSIGLNYSYFTAQQDATIFYFNKNQTADFIFYSSYGPMAVNMNTMLQDFNPAPWITTLKASYSYTSKINMLQVPIEAKWYFINGKKLNLYTVLGASGMFVVSERTNLSVIKEHMTNNLSYNQVNTTKFNALLMLGLGGDVRLYKKLYFTVDGGFRYGTANLSNTAGIKTYPTYFSINGGLKIRL